MILDPTLKVIRESLDYLYEHKPIVQNVLTMALYDEVTDIIYEQLYEGMKAQIQFEIRHGVEFNVDIDILADFIAGAYYIQCMLGFKTAKNVQ